jgi:hypothetical protein
MAFAAAAQLERMARVGDMTNGAGGVARLIAEIDRLRPALRDLLAGRSGGIDTLMAEEGSRHDRAITRDDCVPGK